MGKLRYQRVGVTVKSELPAREESVMTILDLLRKSGADIFIDTSRMKDLQGMKSYADLAHAGAVDLLIVIGGDGTILRAIRELHDLSVPVLGINRGMIGFLTELDFSELSFLPALLEKGGVLEERSLLSVRVRSAKREVFAGIALNDVVVTQGTIARLFNLQTHINGDALAQFRADGLIISTPTGSTAYNLAAGGPIVHPNLSAMIITPINSHSFSQKPVVVRADSTIEVTYTDQTGRFKDMRVELTIDGQISVPIRAGDNTLVTTDHQTVKFLRREKNSFFPMLRTKLGWG